MSKVKLVAQAITEDLNSEDSMMIEMMEKGTDWLFKLIVFLGAPYLIYLLSQFFTI
ncbi:hypothetical protein [Mesobacillus maritimus]|uniref:Uncharacterized protein n=1 Tax=Mesobacillus maritimus TaxID=1643336 RepID=A0ABS7K360_9BACI|nr:hypothetical protein [Mesobacillus maritimus]MBY0096703.1 hypothetical protein [Mesobacillus maritimus]